jgi:cell division protein FtsB
LPRPNRGGRSRAILRLLLLLATAVIVVDAIVGDQGLLAVRRARRQSSELKADLAGTHAQNVLRRGEKQRLLADFSVIEDAARRDLGMIRRGEKVFILKDLPSPATP